MSKYVFLSPLALPKSLSTLFIPSLRVHNCYLHAQADIGYIYFENSVWSKLRKVYIVKFLNGDQPRGLVVRVSDY